MMTEKEEKKISMDKATIGTSKDSKKSFFHINKDMLRFKIHFFFFEGGTASACPFVPVVAKNVLGLSATSLAVVITAQQLITIFSKPIIGYIADYFNRIKLMIILLLIIQAVSFFLILAIPPLKKSTFSLSNQVQKKTDLPEFAIFKMRLPKSNSCFVDTNLTYRVCKNESELDVENTTLIDFDCYLQIKSPKELLCFQNEDYKLTDINLETKLDCCCSIIGTESYTKVNNRYNKTTNLNIILLDMNYDEYQPNKTFPCSMMITNGTNHLPETPAESDMNDFETLEFWLFAVVKIISGICVSSLFCLSDTACCESVQKLGGEFGRQRMFGAIGWGLLAAISGIICDLTGGYLASWIFMAVLQMIAVWNISKLDLVKPHFSQNLLKDVGKVLKSLEFTAFELGVFVNGIGAGIVWFYLIWFLADLGASKFLCGLTQYIQCFVGEVPFMFFADWFIQKLGHFNLISLSLTSYALRFLWYSYLQNPWLVLPAEIAHGFTYGTFFPVVVSYGKKSAKPGTEATTQSILFMTHGGLGAGIGCILTGMCFDKIGTHQAFFYFSMIFAVAVVLNVMITLFFNGRNNKMLSISI